MAIPKGTTVLGMFLANHFNPKYFREPEQFNPSRWLPENQTDDLKKNVHAYIPFSSGPRNCIGQHMALVEARVILGIFMKTFDYKITEGYKLRMSVGFLYEPMEPLTLELK
mmetsp:Transcript_20086/g.28299  ORF Transcript_20086/g.28299 Transcript_20086/m.28299 type:complete len:111 (-) Transcript_20086:31-363(-)